MGKIIKTLLLCKHSPIPGASGSGNYEDKSYFTLGRFHALSIYETPGKLNKWLEGVLEDKQKIINQITDTISYHPIHLVRCTKENEKVPEPPEDSVLLVTFVYGLNNSSGQGKEIDSLRSITLQDKKYLFSKKVDDSIAVVEVYQCINISDRVILTYTKDIYAALRAIHQLKTDVVADKTYTTVNLPLDKELGKDKTIRAGVLDILKKTPEKNKDGVSLGVCIRGTVRNAKEWADCYNGDNLGGKQENIKKCINDPQYYTNYGSADFTVIGKTDGEKLKSLLSYYLNHTDNITKACWDIHTELQLIGLPREGEAAHEDKYVLNGFSQKFNKIYEDKNFPSDWDWKYALKELIQAQNNIDKSPLLQGPTYLLWDSFTVLYDYLAGAVRNKDKIKDISDIKVMIDGSRDYIERYIRCLSQLTDQLIRNDDIVFHGLGSIPAISTAIPENLLEFYHVFLQRLSKALIEIDKKNYNESMIDLEYKYGFLIAPELNKRARICQVFNTELRYYQRQGDFRPWPSKQIYIIQLPIRDIFSPLQCMIPLVHECFHFFGDKLRCRRERAYYATLFLAEAYVDGVLAPAVALSPALRGYAVNEASWLLWDKAPIPKDESELYSKRLQEKLIKQYRVLMTDEKTNDLYNSLEETEESGAFLYYNNSVSERWEVEKNYLSEPSGKYETFTGSRIVKKCMYFFKECYADFMTVTALKISIDEYLRAFEYEMMRAWAAYEDEKDEDKKDEYQIKIVTICQRIAIVLAAYNLSNDREFKYPNGPIPEDLITVRIITKKCYDSLIQEGADPLQPRMDNGEGYYGVFPVASLRSVVDYLCEAYDVYNKKENKESLSAIQKLFESHIREERMFDSDEENIVKKARDDIRKEAQKWNCERPNPQ